VLFQVAWSHHGHLHQPATSAGQGVRDNRGSEGVAECGRGGSVGVATPTPREASREPRVLCGGRGSAADWQSAGVIG
jgi:hypothetical protein